MLRAIIAGVVGVVAGALLGIGITIAAVGLLPVVAGGTLVCAVNTEGAVTTCKTDNGQQVKVPHHIRIQQSPSA